MRNGMERHFDELKDGIIEHDHLPRQRGHQAEMLARRHPVLDEHPQPSSDGDPLEPREAVRQLHVMYGIAITNKLTDDYDYIRYDYGQLASDIHRVLLGITNLGEVEIELRWLADMWAEISRTSDGRTAALFSSWSQNVEGMIR